VRVVAHADGLIAECCRCGGQVKIDDAEKVRIKMLDDAGVAAMLRFKSS